jgi:hypothetical protein
MDHGDVVIGITAVGAIEGDLGARRLGLLLTI